MTIGAARELRVGRLRIRGADCGWALGRLLGPADLHPPGLPPAAVLVVRALADPRPGTLDPRAAALPAPWRDALLGVLEREAATAARPALGPVGAAARAVLFADRAELLACLARDAGAGAVGGCWWWQALGLRTSEHAVTAFAATPEAVPAAVEQLVAAGSAVAFARTLPAARAADLARAVAAVFGVDAAVEAAFAAPATPATRTGAAVSPWHAYVPTMPGVTREQAAFLGLMVALRRDPASVRTRAFVTAVAAWLAASQDAAPVDAVPAAEASPSAAPMPRAERGAPRATLVAAPPASPGAVIVPAHAPPAPLHARAAPAPSLPRPGLPPAGAVARRPDPAPPERRAVAATARARPVTPIAPVARAVDTGLGGVFHLIYVAQRLGLYGDFTTPAQPGLALDPWDCVALLGRRLLRAPPDPLWALLRDVAAPSRRFRPPPAWRVRRAWLDPFADDRRAWTLARSADRLVLRHPAGFAVLDAAPGRLPRELRWAPRLRAGPPPRLPHDPLRRWVAHLAAYVRARLALALGVPARDAAPLALRRPARVLVTDTRIDVISSLADLPLEVRLAGLDRDPGFIPAAGRSLCFHFT